MIRRLVLATAAVMALFGVVSPATATDDWRHDDRRWGAYQSRGHLEDGRSRYDRVLPPRVIVHKLVRRGFSDIGDVRLRGETYAVSATSPRGHAVRLVLSATTGDFIGFRRIDDDYRDRRFGANARAYWD